MGNHGLLVVEVGFAYPRSHTHTLSVHQNVL